MVPEVNADSYKFVLKYLGRWLCHCHLTNFFIMKLQLLDCKKLVLWSNTNLRVLFAAAVSNLLQGFKSKTSLVSILTPNYQEILDRAMYFASVVPRATCICNLDAHKIGQLA